MKATPCVSVAGQNGSFSNVFTAHPNTRRQMLKGKWESNNMSGGNEGYQDGSGGGMTVI